MTESSSAIASRSDRASPPKAGSQAEFQFSGPVAQDARSIADLIASCPPLDTNSLYCILLQTTHFAATCIKAERNGVLEGWISGYRPPDEPAAMFVWQVAVREGARGLGLGLTMLTALFRRPAVADARKLITTIAPTNQASRRLFATFAESRGASMEIIPWFDRELHFGNRHESEELVSIGPL